MQFCANLIVILVIIKVLFVLRNTATARTIKFELKIEFTQNEVKLCNFSS